MTRAARWSIAAATAAVLGAALSPTPGTVQAAGVLGALRSPGEVGIVLSHRGDMGSAPENTIAAFERAITMGEIVLETDIQLTADDVPILMHDWTVDRTTNGSGPVWEHTYDELARLDAGGWYAPEFAGTRVPTLAQFLALIQPSGARAILELKGSWTNQQAAIVGSLIDRHGVRDRVVVASFSLPTLQALSEAAPDVPRILISREVNGDPAVLASLSGAVAIIVSEAFITSRPEVVSRIHSAGLGVMVYTMNTDASWELAIALGVDGIITDNPREFVAWADRTAALEP